MTESALFIGLMCGTSLDGIDAALVGFQQDQPILHATLAHPLPGSLRKEIESVFAAADSLALDQVGQLDHKLGLVFADAAVALCTRAGINTRQIRAIGSHGLNLRHTPTGPTPFTWQIADPNVIAEQTGITTVADFRRRDVAAGGQGAPLAPAFHAAVLASATEPRVILNLGGIANLTWLPDDSGEGIRGFDTGPANGLLDAWIQDQRGAAFDRDGSWARSGKINVALLEQLLKDPYFAVAPPKSTGREHFQLSWLKAQLNPDLPPQDIQATLAELTARSVSAAVNQWMRDARQLFVCGGGAHNGYLLERLGENLPGVAVASTAQLGVDPDWVEAMAFAWLARQTLNKNAGNIPSVTGASGPRILGGVYYA